MVRLHWVKVWDIKTEQVRDSFDSSGILFKAFWKRRLMCPHSRKCSEVSPIIYFWFRSSSHSKLWRGRGKLSEKRIKAILGPKFTSQQVVSHPSAAGNGLFLQEICAWVTSVLFHTQRRQILCVQWLLQPLSSSKKKKDPSQQLNSKIISLLLPGSGFQ